MRFPIIKVYRAFPELDRLTDDECERIVRNARTKRTALTVTFPLVAGVSAFILWPAAVWWGWVNLPLSRTVPYLGSGHGQLLWFAVTQAAVPSVLAFAARDVSLWIAIRGEVAAARCPRCGYSLHGMRVEYIGVHVGEPGRSFVRCPECGRRWNLLDIGLTPRDLAPWEERGLPEELGKAWPVKR